MQQTVESSTIASIYTDLHTQIEQLLLLLTQREKNVIESRFALNQPKKATLEEIGQKFNVTRERVRQIEKNALNKLKRNIGTFKANEINDQAIDILSSKGGLMKEEDLLAELINRRQEELEYKVLFILSLDKRFDRRTNTIAYFPYFKLASISDELLDKVAAKTIQILKEHKNLVSFNDAKSQLKSVSNYEIISERLLHSLFTIYKQFKVVDNSVGLISWKHIHPRTLRDKIFYVLRHTKKPLHFVDIANTIINNKFDTKNVNMQAVHNELIRNDDFILIGRGIYALKEWGYSTGTVADVIIDILRDKDNLEENQIISEVLKKRKVKPITIILNLKNKSQFERVGRKRYRLKAL
jgi:hypothetical protein